MGFVLAALLATTFAQERADLPREIDTWYSIIKDRQAVGYVHETLKHALKPGRYEYLFERELEMKPHVEDLMVSAVLDETLTPTELSSEVHSNGIPFGIVMYTGDDRRLEARPFVGEPVLWTHPSRDDFHLFPTLTLYALRQNDTLAKPGRITLRTADARAVEVVLEVGAPVRREYLGKEGPVTPVRFLKPFPAPSAETELVEAFVDRYGRIVEARMAGGARLLIVENNLEALAAVGAVRRQGRRDIFDKLTAMRNAARERERAREGRPGIDPPAVTPDSLRSDLEAALKMADEIRSLKAQGELEEARKTYLQMLVHLRAVRRVAERARPELFPAIMEGRDLAELAWDGAAQLRNAAAREFVKVKGQMDNLHVEAMEQTHRTLVAFLDRIEVEGRSERQEIADWAAEVGTLVVKCRTRRALAQMRLDVSAIALWETRTTETVDAPLWGGVEVPFVRPFAEAEINGRVYRQGDTIAGTQVKVDRITAHAVQVSLRGETRDVPLRR
jgi:hypothetical protein